MVGKPARQHHRSAKGVRRSPKSKGGETIVRGGFGIFYDRPQGNMVFDMINGVAAPRTLQLVTRVRF